MKTDLTLEKLNFLSEELEQMREVGLYRSLREIQLTDSVHGILNGEPVTLFCSNDYLGLSGDPEIKKVFQEAIAEQAGSGASRLISGTSPDHQALEKDIARFLGKESALLFSSGYMANLGVLTALAGEDDVIVMGKLSHASIIDAVKLSGAHLRVYPHGNLERADEILSIEKDRRRKILVTDSIFSMDGDRAPLKGLVGLKKKHGAILVLDEAHGFGVFGMSGKGLAEEEGLLDEIDVYIATLSKAAGLIGGFVAGSGELRDFLINKARPFIYDTALPPAIARTARLALQKIEASDLRKKLWQNVEKVTQICSAGLNLRYKNACEEVGAVKKLSPIIPLIIGDEKEAMNYSAQLLERGIFIPAVRYPTVPKGKARLRLTVSAAHSTEDFELLKKGLSV